MRDRTALAGSTWRSAKHAWHALAGNPGFSLIVTLVLAVGIAGTTVVYAVAAALLFRPIPYADPSHLGLVTWSASYGSAPAARVHGGTWEVFERLGRKETALDAAAFRSRGANVRGNGWADRVEIGAATSRFLTMTGTTPVVGRRFLPAEYDLDHEPVALIAHSLWQRRFGGDENVVGRTITIDDLSFTIVGVLPRDFQGIDELETGIPAWSSTSLGVLIPLRGAPLVGVPSTSETYSLQILVRLSDKTTLEAARHKLAAISSQLSPVSGLSRLRDLNYTLTPLPEAIREHAPEHLGLVAGAVAVLLLAACANAALLMLQRRETRRHELEVRTALGASPGQLVGEAIAESTLLGVSAAVLGLGLSWGTMKVAIGTGGAIVTGLASARIDGPVTAFAVVASILTALLAGTLPCARLLRDKGADSWLRSPSSSHPASMPGSLPSWLAVVQVSLSVSLIIIGGILARDFARAAGADMGYSADRVVAADVALNITNRGDAGRRYLESLVRGASQMPGVEGAAIVAPCLGSPVVAVQNGTVEGFGEEFLTYRVVSPSLFAMIDVPLVAGRLVSEAELRGAEPVALVNESFARRYWGSARAALGRSIRSSETLSIVGVARDLADVWFQVSPEFYVTPTWELRTNKRWSQLTLFVKASATGSLGRLGGRLTDLAREVNPYQPLFGVRSLKDHVRLRLARSRLIVVLVGTFSALATLMAGVGLYVILAFTVSRRTREFGIRRALGATPQDVLRQVLRGTIGMVVRGVGVTVPLTFGGMWLFAAALLGVTDTDPNTCLWAVAVILAVALLATLVPAWRALRVDPTVALRQE